MLSFQRLVRASSSSAPALYRTSILSKASLAAAPQKSLVPFSQKSRFFSTSSIRSTSTVDPDNVQELVINTTADLMQIKEPADKERITLKTHMKSDLGMDIFKTYQLLDKIEREFDSIDIPIEAVDNAQTLGDIVDLVCKAKVKDSNQ
ncbi:hypothetical protein BGZ46_009598 [Entomortierella lignicola]|nr:hypothetical protein BGZ46_009598 [Entomortierella lignicola]